MCSVPHFETEHTEKGPRGPPSGTDRRDADDGRRNFQLDLAIGAPLETVGPHGSYYGNSVRQQAATAGLGTFNTAGPDMLLDALNQGLGNCAAQARIVVDKQWVETGSVPPVNGPDGFELTVTSVVSATDATVPATLPATGSTDSRPLLFLAIVLVPVGAGQVLAARRRAGTS